jgi:hypothetical protein
MMVQTRTAYKPRYLVTTRRGMRGLGTTCMPGDYPGNAASGGQCIHPGEIWGGLVYPGGGVAPYLSPPIWGVSSTYTNGQVNGAGMVTMCQGYEPGAPGLSISVPKQSAGSFVCPQNVPSGGSGAPGTYSTSPVAASAPAASPVSASAPIAASSSGEPAYVVQSGGGTGVSVDGLPGWAWLLAAAAGAFLLAKAF